MKPRLGLFLPVPFIGYLLAGATSTVMVVAAAIVVVVLFTFVFILMLKGMRGGASPVIELGKLKLFVRPPPSADEEVSPTGEEAPASNASPQLTPDWERKRNLRERVLSLPCGRARSE